MMAPQSVARCEVIDLGTLPGRAESAALDINDRGQVVGWSGLANGEKRAFLWQDGVLQDLGSLGGDSSGATAINEKGQVVGWSGENKNKRAVLWKNGKIRDLGVLPGLDYSMANGINEREEVVGTCDREGVAAERAFLWKQSAMTDLGALPGNPPDDRASAFDINDSGHIVGYSSFYRYDTAFLHKNGTMLPLPNLGGLAVAARGINDRDQVVGWSDTVHGTHFHQHACLWREGKVIDLGTLGGSKSYARAINDKGEIVGWSYPTDDYRQGARAVLWRNNRALDLNNVIPADTGWRLAYAYAINERGQIVGEGILNGKKRAFLRTPARGASR